MAKVVKKNPYESIIRELINEREEQDVDFLTQDDVFEFLDRKKLLVAPDEVDKLLHELINSGVVADEVDEHDFDDAEDDLVNELPEYESFHRKDDGDSDQDFTDEISLKSYDDTQDIDLSLITDKRAISDSEIQNKLIETDDIVK